MWPWLSSSTTPDRPEPHTPDRKKEGKKSNVHISESLVLRSSLFGDLPPAIFIGDVPQTVQDEYLTHGGCLYLLAHYPTDTCPDHSSDVFGVRITKIPVSSPCLVFTPPEDTAFLVDNRGFPLIKYDHTWILHSIRTAKLRDLRKYIAAYPSPPHPHHPHDNIRIGDSEAPSHSGRKRKAHDTPIEALGHRYDHLTKRVCIEQDLARRHSPPDYPPLADRVPKYYLGDSIIALSALQDPSPQVEMVHGKQWKIILPKTLPQFPSPPPSSPHGRSPQYTPKRFVAVRAALHD